MQQLVDSFGGQKADSQRAGHGKTIVIATGIVLTLGLLWLLLHKKPTEAAEPEGWIRDIRLLSGQGDIIDPSVGVFPGQFVTINWSASYPSGNFIIQYKYEEEGEDWINIETTHSASVVPTTYGWYWQVPEEAGHSISIKVSIGSIAAQMDHIALYVNR